MEIVRSVKIPTGSYTQKCDSLFPIYDDQQANIEFVMVFCLKVDQDSNPINYLFITADIST